MTKPTLAILSRRGDLLAELSVRLAAHFEPLLCDDAAEAASLCRFRRPSAVLLDFGDVSRGGDLEGRLLDEVADAVPHAFLRVVTSDLCPEPIARRLRRLGVTPLSARLKAVEIAAELLGPASISAPPPPRMDASAADAGVKREGISRRFETRTPEVASMLRDLEVAARHDVTILLIGETGTGKTFLSRLIHEASPRGGESFLTLACGALSAEWIESELFGHAQGAVTGAHSDKEGKLVAAKSGTVLLDEIDVLAPAQQVKLLRVIESGEFEPVGSNQTCRSLARLIVASNFNLQPLVEEGRFRPDLYYRLNMLKFDLPPLRDRRLDIEPLVLTFVRRIAAKHGIEIARIDRSFLEGLMDYAWPGNVRELENVVQRAVIYSPDGALTARELPPHVSQAGAVTPNRAVRPSDSLESPLTLEARNALSERRIIEQALLRNDFRRMNTARDLGISRVTLYNKMKKHGLQR